MKRIHVVLMTVLILMVCFSTAHALGWGDVTGWFSWTALALLATFVLSLGVIGRYTPWLSKLLIASGALVTDIGLALADGKISADELKKAKDNALAVKRLFMEAKTSG